MLKINSGRKQENGVWRYFSYEPSTDKSRCNVVCSVGEKDSEAHVVETCGALLKGLLNVERAFSVCGDLTHGERTKNLII